MLTAVQLSIAVGVIAAFLTSPCVYRLTNNWTMSLFGVRIADETGAPTNAGLALHAAAIAALVYYVLYYTAPDPVYIPPLSI